MQDPGASGGQQDGYPLNFFKEKAEAGRSSLAGQACFHPAFSSAMEKRSSASVLPGTCSSAR